MLLITMTQILETADELDRYGFWAVYAVLREQGQPRGRALWLIWVAVRTDTHRIKFRM